MSGLPVWLHFQQAVAWIYLFVMMIGFVVTIRHRRLSRFMYLVVIGMAGITAASLIGRVGGLLINYLSVGSNETYQLVFVFPSVIGAISWGMLIYGLSSVFRDLKFQIELLEDAIPPQD